MAKANEFDTLKRLNKTQAGIIQELRRKLNENEEQHRRQIDIQKQQHEQLMYELRQSRQQLNAVLETIVVNQEKLAGCNNESSAYEENQPIYMAENWDTEVDTGQPRANTKSPGATSTTPGSRNQNTGISDEWASLPYMGNDKSLNLNQVSHKDFTDKRTTIQKPLMTSDTQFNLHDYIQKEIEKGIKSKLESVKNTDMNSLNDKMIQLQVVNTELNIKRDYKLCNKSKFDHFLEYLKSKLRSSDTVYIIDKTVQPVLSKESMTKKLDVFKVRDTIISRIDESYFRRVCDIQDPVEMLDKLKEIKNLENNTTTCNIRRNLYSIQFNPSKEKATEFCSRFEELIRTYESLPETNKLPEEEKRDAFYNAIVKAVTDVKSIDFIQRTDRGSRLSYKQLKEFIIQEEAERGGAKDHTTTTALMAKREYPKFCKNYRETGHIKADCPHKGKIKCLVCKELTTHKAANCPRVRPVEQPKFEQNRGSRGNLRNIQT